MLGLIVLELLFVVVVSAVGMSRGKGFQTVEFGPDDYSYNADNAPEDPRAPYLQGNQIEGLTDMGSRRRIITPDVKLLKGVYQVDVDYTSTVPNGSTTGVYISAFDELELYPYSKSEMAYLLSGKEHDSFLIHADEDTTVRIRAIMEDDCMFDVSLGAVTVTRLGMRSVLPFVIKSLFLFLIVDVLLAAYIFEGSALNKYCRENYVVLLGLLAMLIVVSTPLLAGDLLLGFDYRFHYYRIYSLAQGIRSGQIPTYIYPEYMNNYGYPLGLFYPDLFIYFPALLYVVGFRLETAFKLYLLFINVLTIAVSYYSFKRLARGNRAIGFVGTILFVFAMPRIAVMYSRGASGAANCYAFIPLFALGIMRLYELDKDEKHRVPPCVYIALSMSGFIATHVLGSVMAIGLAVLFMLYHWKKLANVQVWIETGKSVVLAALMSAYYIVPFLATYFKVSLGYDADVVRMYERAAKPAQIFSNHYSITSDVQADLIGMNREMPVSIGPASLVVILLAIFVLLPVGKKFVTEGTRKVIRPMLIITFLMLWVTTTLFPFKWLNLHWKWMYGIVTSFQYNYRFLAAPALLVAVMAVVILADLFEGAALKREYLAIGTVALALMFAYQGVDMINAYTDEMPRFEFTDSFRELHLSALYNGEFVPQGFDRSECPSTVEADALYEAGGSFEILEQKGVKLVGYASNPSGQDVEVILPRLYYPGYKVTADGIGVPGETENHRIVITLPAGFSGNVTLDYAAPLYWYLADLLSLAAFVLVIVWGARKARSNAF